MTLSEPKATPEGRYTHLMVLSAAAAREDKLVTKHKRLPGASLQKVCAALVKRGLLAELTGVSRDPDVLHVKTELGMTEYAITPSGLAAIGVDDESPYGEDVPKDVRAGVDPWRRLIERRQIELTSGALLFARNVIAAATGTNHDENPMTNDPPMTHQCPRNNE